MGSSKDFAIRYLKAVEKKYEAYFMDNKLDIMDCVELRGTLLVRVHITDQTLPSEIIKDIEAMFWK